ARIVFVADAHGRSSRAIVAAALRGLACVKHRGAVAADARTADGSGLLVPIPPAVFGERAGVAVLFVRGAGRWGRALWGGPPPPPPGSKLPPQPRASRWSTGASPRSTRPPSAIS